MYLSCAASAFFFVTLLCGGAWGECDVSHQFEGLQALLRDEIHDEIIQYQETVDSLTAIIYQQNDKISRQDDKLSRQDDKISRQEDMIIDLSIKLSQLEYFDTHVKIQLKEQDNVNADLRTKRLRQDETMAVIYSYLSQHDDVIREQSFQLKGHDGTITDISNKLKQQDRKIGYLQAALVVDGKDIQEASYACLGDSLLMSCTDGAITVLQGEYGAYYDSCTEDCCPPGEFDCTESAADKNSEEWQALKDACDGEASCSYIYSEGFMIEGCGLNYTADYLSVVYHCSLGFTAYLDGGSQFPANDETVAFTGTVSNAGGGYSNDTFRFTCPVSGYYYITFSLSILTRDGAYVTCFIEIVMDSTVIVEGRDWHGEVDADQDTQMSQSAVLYCAQGSDIWLQSGHDQCYIYGIDSSRWFTFSGMLLHTA